MQVRYVINIGIDVGIDAANQSNMVWGLNAASEMC